MKIKNIGIFVILLLNLIFLIIFLSTSCDYFRLMTRKEWEERVGFKPDVYFYKMSSYNGFNMHVYKIDYEDNGRLDEISNSPFGLAAANVPYKMNIDPYNKFVYYGTVNVESALYGYNIDKNGELTDLINSMPIYTGFTSNSKICLDPYNRFLYIFDGSTSNIGAYTVDKTTGALQIADGSPYNFGGGSGYSFFVNKNGKFLYLSTTSFNILIFSINQQNGSLIQIDSVTLPQRAISITYHPSNDILAAAEQNNTIQCFRINNDTGSLTQMSGSPYVIGGTSNALGITFNNKGDYLYTTLSPPDNLIYSFKFDENSGSLSNPYSLGAYNSPSEVFIDPSDKYLYVQANDASSGGRIRIYKINGSTFSEISGSPYDGPSMLDMKMIRK